MNASKPRLLVCDLDNTLYDWVSYFVPSFYMMVDEVVRITNCDREKLLDDFKVVHQRSHDSEQPFALLETDTIKSFYPSASTDEVVRKLDSAFHAFNSARKSNLKLYSGVIETLETLRQSDIILVAHTESNLYGVVDRLRRLNIYQYFSRIYCRERLPSFHPSSHQVSGWLDNFPMHLVTELALHQRKPNPAVLLEICARESIPHSNAAYIGDSMSKDILMAKQAGVLAIWAKYGATHESNDYEKLVRISHWTPEEITREKQLKSLTENLEPDRTLESAFNEVLPIMLRR